MNYFQNELNEIRKVVFANFSHKDNGDFGFGFMALTTKNLQLSTLNDLSKLFSVF
jgi:hypothetical protein